MPALSFKNCAVITGDFIGFSPLPAEARQRIYCLAVECGACMKEVFAGCMPYDLDVFRGDGWQVLFSDPAAAYRAGLFFRAFMRACSPVRETDVRMAIGLGSVDYVPAGRVSAGDGEAFRLSGRLLESMSRQGAGSFRLAAGDRPALSALDGMVCLAGSIAQKWTSSQARAVKGALTGMNRKQIAAGWDPPVTSQAAGRHLKRAGWPAVRHSLDVYEKTVGKLFPDSGFRSSSSC